MYVCLCKGITSSDIEDAVVEGRARCMKSLKSCLGVASQCGSCESDSEAVLLAAQQRLGMSEDKPKNTLFPIITPIVLVEG